MFQNLAEYSSYLELFVVIVMLIVMFMLIQMLQSCNLQITIMIIL